MRRQRRREGPAGIDSTEHQGRECKQSADPIEIPAQQIDLREGQVFGSHHDRYQEVPQGGRHGRHQEEEDHDDSMHREELVVRIGGHKVRLRGQQFQANEAGEGAPNKEEERNRDQIEDRDALVVAGKQPTEETILVVEIIALRKSCRRLIRQVQNCVTCAHGFTIPGVVGAAWLDSDVVSVCWTR